MKFHFNPLLAKSSVRLKRNLYLSKHRLNTPRSTELRESSSAKLNNSLQMLLSNNIIQMLLIKYVSKEIFALQTRHIVVISKGNFPRLTLFNGSCNVSNDQDNANIFFARFLDIYDNNKQ